MPRYLLDESKISKKQQRPDLIKRRAVLRDTVKKLSNEAVRTKFVHQAAKNHQTWHMQQIQIPSGQVRVLPGDWGDVTLQLSQETGCIYAVLNMANARVPGGGYLEGAVAQEENMFRRTDCHFHVANEDMDANRHYYTRPMTNLINGTDGRVYLDMEHARVCIKGSEGPDVSGYRDLRQDELFLFYELKSAADDLRGDPPLPFDEESMRRKIAAQLDTLIEKRCRRAVLSAFGCGAFKNPADKVARIYKEELQKRPGAFDDVVFAVYRGAGFGPQDNFEKFKAVLHGLSLGQRAQREQPEQEGQREDAFPSHPVEYPSNPRELTTLPASGLEPVVNKEQLQNVLGNLAVANSAEWNKRGILFFGLKKTPKGIAEIRKVLKSKRSDEQKIQKIKTIIDDHLQHPPKFTNRDPLVQNFYEEAQALINQLGLAAAPGTTREP